MAKTKIDKYGRVLIPKETRESLGIGPGEDIRIRVRGSELIMRPVSGRTDEKVKDLADYLEKNAPEPFVSPPSEEDSKWMTKKRALRKLGM